jgi:hypothetical protein
VSIATKLKIMSTVTKENGPRELVGRLAKLMYSTSESYVLRRDLSVPLVPRPEAKVPISIRPLEPRDLPQIERERPEGLLMGVIRTGLKQCYVALTEGQEVCFLQWLITPEQRDQIMSIRFREMHMFDYDTVMLEFSYTFKRFRGLGIMAPVVAWVAEQDKRARWAVTYVDRANVPSLRGCRRAGFYPSLVTNDRWRFFRLVQSVNTPKSLESFWTEAANAPKDSRGLSHEIRGN